MPKIVKITLITLGSIIGLLLLTWILLQMPFAQRMIANKLTRTISEELGTEFSISGLKIDYFDKVELENALLRDEEGDTLFFIAALEANYNLWSWNSENIHFDKIRLEEPKVQFWTKEGKRRMNLSFLTDYLKVDSTSSGKSPLVIIDNIVLRNGSFLLRNDNSQAPTDRRFNENNMLFYRIAGELQDFRIEQDTISFLSKELMANERSGLVVNELKTICRITPQQMSYNAIKLLTNESSLNGRLQFDYKDYGAFDSFIQQVEMSTQLQASSIHTNDLAHFTNSLDSFDLLISIDGQSSGTVDNLGFQNISASIGEYTTFRGSGSIIGLPETSSAQFNIRSNAFASNAKGLRQILLTEALPTEVDRMGNFAFQGHFVGQLNRFRTWGMLTSALGKAEADLRLDLVQSGKEKYTGSLNSSSFDLGKLLDNAEIGYTSFDVSIDGSGLSLKNMNAEIDGHVAAIDLYDYNYHNITVKGNFKQDIFSGHAHIRDPNVEMGFDGTIDLSSDEYKTNIVTNVRNLDLKALGLGNNDSRFSLVGSFDLRGADVDHLNGEIALDSLSWITKDKRFPLNNIDLRINQEDDRKSIVLASDLIDAELLGNYQLSSLGTTFKEMVDLVYPENGIDSTSDLGKVLSFKLDIKKYHPIFSNYLGGMVFEQVGAELNYDAQLGAVAMEGEIQQLEISDIHSTNFTASLTKSDHFNESKISVIADNFSLGDSLLFYEVNTQAHIVKDEIVFSTNARKNENLNAKLQGLLHLHDSDAYITFEQFQTTINGKQWALNTEDARIRFLERRTALEMFVFQNKDESIFFDGSFGADQQRMNLGLMNFSLHNANPFLRSANTEIQGRATGSIDLPFVEGHPLFETDINITDFALNGDTLGTLKLRSEINQQLVLKVNGELKDGLLNGMQITGDVDFNNPKEALDLHLTSQHSSIKPFAKYLSGLVSDLEGTTTANLSVTGPIEAPKLSGIASFKKMAFTVNYLQTHYKGSAILDVTNNAFTIKEARITDRFNKIGRASGSITHKNYSNFNFDLTIDQLDGFECLNTQRKDNDLFYGSAFAKGYMQVLGPLDDLLLLIRAKSTKNTNIHIPLDNAEETGQLGYVQFVDLRSKDTTLKEVIQESSGVRMDFNFEITNDANVELIFDELLGDKIKAQGHGNLRMEINTLGDFFMYGTMTIDKGDYLFTAFNIINKYFTVNQGSTIAWDGDPLNAKLDLTAVKREYPQPLPLVRGFIDPDNPEEAEPYKTPVAVDCEMKLTGLLFDPNIAFDISLPNQSSIASNVGSVFNTTLGRVKEDQEELDRQVFALLALGSFITPSFSGTSTGPTTFDVQSSVNNSLSDFISGQLSNWLSQLYPGWQVGIDYQMADPTNINPELVVSLRKKLLNDRLELAGSYDYGAVSGSNPYDFNVQYNISEDGNMKVRGFTRNANDPTLGQFNNTITSGVGFYWRIQFDHFISPAKATETPEIQQDTTTVDSLKL